jgi:hypothetical protein
MADGMTTTGLDELRAAVNALPDRVREASRAVAASTAQRVLEGARQRLLAQEKHPTGATAALIAAHEDAPNRQFIVSSPSPSQYPGNTVLWLEHGTSKQAGLHYMHDAVMAEDAQYRAEMNAVVEALVRDALE